MAITDDNGNFNVSMPVQPMNYGYPMGGGFGGGFGDNESWLILFIILAMSGNWGGFGGFGGGIGNAVGDSMMLWPWLMTQNVDTDVQGGFNQLATQNAITGVQNAVTSGFGDTALGIAGINQGICQTGNATVAAVTGAQNAVTQQMYTNQIADLERSFNAQTANTAALSALQAQMAQCCCDNKAGLADVKYTIATEACADRAAVNDALRDLLTAQTAGFQSIKDQMCQDKIDAKNEEIANLRQQVNMQNLAASQAAQTAQLIADNTAQTQYVVNRIAPYPTPAYIVQNPNSTCGCNTAVGCGF